MSSVPFVTNLDDGTTVRWNEYTSKQLEDTGLVYARGASFEMHSRNVKVMIGVRESKSRYVWAMDFGSDFSVYGGADSLAEAFDTIEERIARFDGNVMTIMYDDEEFVE